MSSYTRAMSLIARPVLQAFKNGAVRYSTNVTKKMKKIILGPCAEPKDGRNLLQHDEVKTAVGWGSAVVVLVHGLPRGVFH